MAKKKQADSTEKPSRAGLIERLTSRRAEFASIRDKAEGAIQACDIILSDLRRADEQEQAKEPAETGEVESSLPGAAANGNGHAAEAGE